MTLIAILLVTAALALLLFGLANSWAQTPHGRLKPIFALAFGLQGIFDKKTREGVLAIEPMDTPAQREKVRAAFLASVAPLAKPESFGGRIRDRAIEGPGGPLLIRIYEPSGEGPFPLFLYMHGGGFIVGSPEYTDNLTRAVAQQAPAVVVSVDYRLSPEAPYPAAIEDCECVLDWCLANAQDLDVSPGKIAVGGDSAGGNLAAVLSQRDRASGRRRIGLQVLIYPATDATRRDRESQLAFASGYGLSLKDVDRCFAHYVGGDDSANDPGVSPLLAPALEGLPEALIFTAGFDVLRDEGTEYAERLEKAGVAVEHVRAAQMPHGYITMTRVCGEAREHHGKIADSLRRLALER